MRGNYEQLQGNHFFKSSIIKVRFRVIDTNILYVTTSYRPIAKLSDRAFILHENEAYCVKKIILLYFYVSKSEFECLRRVFMVISSFFSIFLF